MPTFEKPSVADLRHAADQLGMNPSMMYLNTVQDILAPLVAAYAALDAVPDEKPAVKYPRDGGWRPAPDENKLGAWYIKTSIKGKPGGKLAGRRVALKDNVCLAGVPMMVGAAFLEGSVPDIDATIVNRILDEGGEIAGKAVCEYYCVSGGSHTSSTGPVQNPRKHGYTTGGSSSGSAALGRGGRSADGDRRRSGRLDPHSGELLRHRRHEADLRPRALHRHRAAGDHHRHRGSDDRKRRRQRAAARGARRARRSRRAPAPGPRVDKYTEALRQGVKGLRIGVLKEGFGHPNAEPDVDAKVRAAAERFKSLGAIVEDVSVPEHLTLGFPVWAAIRGDAACVTLLEMNGFGLGYEGLYPLSAIQAAMKWRDHADEFADTLKIATIFSKYTLDRYGGHYYGKAQNLRRRLRAAYDAALASHDLLLLPTTVIKATPIPPPGASPQEITRRSWEGTRNTCPFNVTGHPAISIPCGMEDGRPIGMMLVGKHWDERTIYRASAAFERSGDWMKF